MAVLDCDLRAWQGLGMTTRAVLTSGMAIDGELTACLALNGKCLWAASSPTVGFASSLMMIHLMCVTDVRRLSGLA